MKYDLFTDMIRFVKILSLVVFVYLASDIHVSKNFVPIFEYIHRHQDALLLTKSISNLGYEYSSSDGGHIVTVDPNLKYEIIVALAKQKQFPKSTLNPELAVNDDFSFGLTEDELAAYITEYIERYLSKLISLLFKTKVDTRVYRQPSVLFNTDPYFKNTSLTIQLKSKVIDLDEKLNDLFYIAKHTILGLKKSNILILDTDGKVLNETLKSEYNHSFQTLKKQAAIESDLAKVLSGVIINSKYRIQLNLDLDLHCYCKNKSKLFEANRKLEKTHRIIDAELLLFINNISNYKEIITRAEIEDLIQEIVVQYGYYNTEIKFYNLEN